MTKEECLQRADRCQHAAQVALESASLYAATFGLKDDLTQRAFLDRDVALEAAGKWHNLASLHPKTRDALLRARKLPPFMFGY